MEGVTGSETTAHEQTHELSTRSRLRFDSDVHPRGERDIAVKKLAEKLVGKAAKPLELDEATLGKSTLCGHRVEVSPHLGGSAWRDPSLSRVPVPRPPRQAAAWTS